MSTIQGLGFGYIPEETIHHYLVRISRGKNDKVLVYEIFYWDDGEVQESEINYDNTKVILDRHKKTIK